jgi:arsenate reductase
MELKTRFYTPLKIAIKSILLIPISDKRKDTLQELIDYIDQKFKDGKKTKLNFICTHNSRRSQFAQVWAQTAADYFNVAVDCYSGGTETTAFNERVVAALQSVGFRITTKGGANPVYKVFYSDDISPITAYSKLFNNQVNPTSGFAAIMTCADADANCPIIPGAEKRIPLNYNDPKAFDGTVEETTKYDERSMQIASELFYVFSKIKS